MSTSIRIMPGSDVRPADPCYHGGAFFEAVGDEFDRLAHKDEIVSADVLDAWFDPSPRVMAALAEHLAWSLRTSPPTGCDGMRRVIAESRGVDADNILPGGGSSDLIFLALRHWLRPDSRVLILDPMYGEYAHVLEQVIGCRVERFGLRHDEQYDVDCDRLESRLRQRYDVVIIVNPNSPTGRHVDRARLERVLNNAPSTTRFWIDETYVDYVGAEQSLERFAAASDNVVVCKSMSKVYALSGVRAAYLCGPAEIIRDLRAISPPWAVSLPGQIAACEALRSADYYRARWSETHVLREALSAALTDLGWNITPGCANFLLCHLPLDWPEAYTLVRACRERGLFIRDIGSMGRCFDRRTVRIAVKDRITNERMIEILGLCR